MNERHLSLRLTPSFQEFDHVEFRHFPDETPTTDNFPLNRRAAPATAVLDQCGRYRIPNGPTVEAQRDGTNLTIELGDHGGELLAQDETNIYLPTSTLFEF